MNRRVIAAALAMLVVMSGIAVADSDEVNANVSERPLCINSTDDTATAKVDVFGLNRGTTEVDVILLATDVNEPYYNLSDVETLDVTPGEEVKHEIETNWPLEGYTFESGNIQSTEQRAGPGYIDEGNYTLVVVVKDSGGEWEEEGTYEGDAALGMCAAGEEDDDDSGVIGAIKDNADFVTTLVTNPLQVILGGVFSLLVGGIEAIWTTILDALNLVWYGSEAESTAGMLGLADIPIFIAEIFIGMGVGIGETAFDLVDAMWDGAEDIVDGLGPLALPVTVGALIAVIVAMQRFARRLGPAFLEAIPVIGPFLKNLLLGP